MFTIIDLRSSPYSKKSEIEKELDQVKKLEASVERDQAIKTLERYLKSAEELETTTQP